MPTVAVPDRPLSRRVAAWLLAAEGVGAAATGVGFVVAAMAAHPHDRGTAALLGALLIVLGAACLATGRGLWRGHPRAGTPAYLVQFFAVVVGIGQLHTLPEAAAPMLAVALAATAALSLPATRARLRR
jgi:hypothetical protein